ncbi:MAG TPA: type 2 isopentenyl-diphosphate Delta-isomerase [Balneolaceae bacterium]|nr:type 2 isopentenyl-diphosphate Delta-isomerase [Balneolaceae bacterium]
MSQIKQRKKDHVQLTLTGEVNYEKGTGFENYQFVHNALPEVNFEEVSTDVTFLGRAFSFPLFISSMTGGYTDAGRVNTIIAEFCEDHDLPFGVGSQRVMLEDADTEQTFSIVREKAPNAFIASNIGGAQLIGGLSKHKMNRMIDSIKADAVIVHLNPLQELMQPEGDRNFKGIESGIAQLVKESPVPVIVKETGAGISGEVAARLLELGVSVIDIAGAGGTSWAKIENTRTSNHNPQTIFDNWGLTTLDCLRETADLKDKNDFEVIASGGIKSSFDIVKSLCLGADFTASASPVINALADDGYEGLKNLFDTWEFQVKIILSLLGCTNIGELSPKHIQFTGTAK